MKFPGLERWFGKRMGTIRNERPQRKMFVRPFVEALEERVLLDAAALVVGRTLSADTTAAIQDNQLEITYTVYNEQANDVSGVLLTDTLQPGVTFQRATALPDRNGQELAWSLGTIPGFGRASVGLTVSLANPMPLQLDSGAHGFAILNAGAVTADTPAATLRAGSIDPGLLASTPDANTTDPFVQEKAAELRYDPQQIFNFLQTQIGYNSYTGSLRGARGTLWSSAGNSLDEASLGVALLRGSGIPAQYAEGTLTTGQAQQLILSMFPASYQTVGYIAPGTQTADPANDPQLLSETKDHFWVQFDAGNGMQDADPEFAGAQIGQSFAAVTNTFTEVPDSMRHKVEIKLNAEFYNPLPGLQTTTVLDQTFATVDLVGRPLSIGHIVTQTGIPGLVFATTTNTYSPYLQVGDEANPDPSHDQIIRGKDYQEVLTNFPLGSQVLTGLFLDVNLTGPHYEDTYERALVDRIGFAARQNGGTLNVTVDGKGPPALTPFDLFTVNILPGLQDAAPMGALQVYVAQTQTTLAHSLGATSPPTLSRLLQNLTAFARLELVQFLTGSGHETGGLATVSEVQAYYDRPRVTIFSSQVDPATKTFDYAIDLRRDQMRVVPSPGQNPTVMQAFNFARGLVDNAIEESIIPATAGSVSIGTFSVLQSAVAQGIPFVLLSQQNSATLDKLNLPVEAKARINAAIGQGQVVLVR
jgi:hypothetical protein